MSARSGPAYDYVMLAEAADRQRLANLYAVVVECSIPRPTKGTDMVSNLRLVDPSTATNPQFPDGFEMLAFSAQQHHLPTLRRSGDIIRLHRVTVTQYNGKPQLIAKIHKAKECSFCLFDGQLQGSNTPYQTSSETYTLEGRDPGILTALRNFGRLLNSSNLGGATAYMKRIKDIRAGAFFDVICQVLCINDEHLDAPVMFVWDGTDALPLPLTVDQLEATAGDTLSEGVQPDPAWLAARRQAMRVHGRNVVADLPVLGTALPVIVTQPSHADRQGKGPLQLPSVGKWVKLRNVKAWVVAGQLQGRYLPNSKWAPCDADEGALAEDAHRRQVNNVAGWAPGESQQWLATTHQTQPFTSLRSLQIQAGTGRPHKDRCLVNVLRFLPADVQDLCHTRAQLGLPHTDDTKGDWVYLIKLHLQDATGEVDAALFDRDADEFFQGYPARDYSIETENGDPSEACTALQQKMDALLGLHNARDGGVWMDCCIKTYFTDRDRPLDTCQFRLFGTRLR
ncbi:hypothetical protein ABBQ38_009163 [Trebouxia sp. C0009 RCD-2024]